MVVHSFDIGIRHLGFASLRVFLQPNHQRRFTFEVLDWRVIDCATIADCEEADLNKTTLQGVIWITSTAWQKQTDVLVDQQERPDWLLLESQPMRNRKMQFVSHNLLAFLLGHWSRKGHTPQSCFVSGRVKLQEADFRELLEKSNKAEAKQEGRRRTTKEKRADESKKYNENKKHAKLMTEVVLQENCRQDSDRYLEWFRNLGYKRDDAADALLQGVYKARDLLECSRKRPRDIRTAMGVKFKKAQKRPRVRTKAKKLAASADEGLCDMD